jgi:hypothetical protein
LAIPKVLLITGTPPGSQGVGGIFLHDLCLAYPKDHICCFAITWPKYMSISHDLDWLPIAYVKEPRLRISAIGSQIAYFSGLFLRTYFFSLKKNYLKSLVVDFGKRHNVDTMGCFG